MASVCKGKQLHVVIEDRPGAGAAVFGALAAAKVNVTATCCWGMQGEAHFQIVPEDINEARKALRKAKLKVASEDVVIVDIPNRPGAYTAVLQKLADKGIDARMAYVTAASKKEARLVLMTASDARAVKLLAG